MQSLLIVPLPASAIPDNRCNLFTAPLKMDRIVDQVQISFPSESSFSLLERCRMVIR